MKVSNILLNLFLTFTLFSNIVSQTPDGVLHFIRCGSGDSILIEENGHFGLIDSSNPYKYIENEVHPVEIDPSKGEVNQWTDNPNNSIQAVLYYLEYLHVQKLDFILATHAHSDHDGGIPALAYKYVDSNTKFYYREYRATQEERTHIDWANYKYYKAAYESMSAKNAEMVEITGRTVNFMFGEMKIEFLNTDIDPDELNLGENQNSIVTLITYKNTKIFLAADMIWKDDRVIKDYIGKIDILKLAHHGYSESSYEFLSSARPDYVVISNNNVPDYGKNLVAYLQQIIKSKVYLTGNVKSATDKVDQAAIKLYLVNNENNYYFQNTGDEVKIGDINGWQGWVDKWTYLEKGILVKGWKQLDWSKGKNWFYFDEEGIMLIGWQQLEWKEELHWYYFDKDNGYMVTGWQTLNWSKGVCKFYFESSGAMLENICKDISGVNYCFDSNGCLIN